MAAAYSTIAVRDGNSSLVAGGVAALDQSGANAGPWNFANIIVDGTSGINRLTINSAGQILTITNIGSFGGTSITQGQAAMAASIPVVIANNQSSIPITGASGSLSTNISSFGGTAVTIGQGSMAASMPVAIASNQSILQVNATSSFSANIGSFGGTAITLGQAAMASSIPVTIANNQSSIPITGAAGSLSTNISSFGGTAVTIGQGAMAASVPVAIASNQSILQVNATSSFSANIGSFGGTAITLGQAAMASSIPVTVASNQSILQVNATSSFSVNVGSFGGTAVALGQTTMASSIPVNIASNQSNINVTPVPATSGGLSIASALSAAGNNVTQVKSGAGQLYGVECFNNSSTLAYLKVYATATVASAGSGTPALRVLIPHNSGNGAGVVHSFEMGLPFANGISYTCTLGIADSDQTNTAANLLIFNLFYK